MHSIGKTRQGINAIKKVIVTLTRRIEVDDED
jgi:hypothetical protein